MAVPAALAGGAAAWLSPPGHGSVNLAPEAKRAETPSVGALVAALSLDDRRRNLRLPHGSRRSGASIVGTHSRPGVPVRISLPTAGVSGPVERMRQRGGELQIPEPGRAGWFAAGPRPGELGRAVIVSHVDTKEGPALFYSLLQLPRGSRVSVRDARGRTHRFAVVRRRQVAKTEFRAASAFGGASSAMLVLITCGGPFDPDTGYRDNVIIYARAI